MSRAPLASRLSGVSVRRICTRLSSTASARPAAAAMGSTYCMPSRSAASRPVSGPTTKSQSGALKSARRNRAFTAMRSRSPGSVFAFAAVTCRFATSAMPGSEQYSPTPSPSTAHNHRPGGNSFTPCQRKAGLTRPTRAGRSVSDGITRATPREPSVGSPTRCSRAGPLVVTEACGSAPRAATCSGPNNTVRRPSWPISTAASRGGGRPAGVSSVASSCPLRSASFVTRSRSSVCRLTERAVFAISASSARLSAASIVRWDSTASSTSGAPAAITNRASTRSPTRLSRRRRSMARMRIQKSVARPWKPPLRARITSSWLCLAVSGETERPSAPMLYRS